MVLAEKTLRPAAASGQETPRPLPQV